MLTPCAGRCGRSVKVGTGGRCPECRNPARRLRSAQAWRRYAETVRAVGICARCLSTEGPFEANHIVRLTDDLSSARAECLCRPCHRDVSLLQRRGHTV